MTRSHIALTVALALPVGGSAALPLQSTPAATQKTAPTGDPACDLERLTAAGITKTTVRTAAWIADGTFTPARASAPITNLPAFCRVEASVSPDDTTVVNFEVWIPRDWNGKLVSTGNGGYSNVISYRDMAYALSQHYAAVGGDTGHQTPTPDDLLWGVDHPDRIAEWGTRSIHSTFGPARGIVERVQGKAPSRSYFYGCSTGGHQGYAEIQRYPDDFDGVIAGAPGSNRVRLNAAFVWQFLVNHEPNDNTRPILSAAELPVITKAIVAACDAGDGVTDGVVDDPRRCRFDPSALECRAGASGNCLTAAQVAALKKMYAGARNPRTGEEVYPGWPPSSEALTVNADGRPASGWHMYWGTTEPTRAAFWRHWVFADPKWDWWSFDFDRDVARAVDKVGPLVDQVNPDIGAFARRGGKAIVYHGWQDPVVNPLDTIAYYEKVRAQQGSQQDVDRFFRLFLVPGMGHCSGGTGATSFGNQISPSPVVDAGHDLLTALDRWVERNEPPARIVASRVENGSVVRTRPLCPYPTRATYSGTGSTDDAANFVCRQ